MKNATCQWLELCDRPSAGLAAHFMHGVIDVCAYHVDLFQIELIKTYENKGASA